MIRTKDTQIVWNKFILWIVTDVHFTFCYSNKSHAPESINVILITSTNLSVITSIRNEFLFVFFVKILHVSVIDIEDAVRAVNFQFSNVIFAKEIISHLISMQLNTVVYAQIKLLHKFFI